MPEPVGVYTTRLRCISTSVTEARRVPRQHAPRILQITVRGAASAVYLPRGENALPRGGLGCRPVRRLRAGSRTRRGLQESPRAPAPTVFLRPRGAHGGVTGERSFARYCEPGDNTRCRLHLTSVSVPPSSILRSLLYLMGRLFAVVATAQGPGVLREAVRSLLGGREVPRGKGLAVEIGHHRVRVRRRQIEQRVRRVLWFAQTGQSRRR